METFLVDISSSQIPTHGNTTLANKFRYCVYTAHQEQDIKIPGGASIDTMFLRVAFASQPFGLTERTPWLAFYCFRLSVYR